jgi:hypothetical protein
VYAVLSNANNQGLAISVLDFGSRYDVRIRVVAVLAVGVERGFSDTSGLPGGRRFVDFETICSRCGYKERVYGGTSRGPMMKLHSQSDKGRKPTDRNDIPRRQK